MLDVHALRIFLEAATAESFTRAAEALDLTQPAVSHHIKTLEDYLQVQLFERDGRSVRLTKAGQALVPLARQAVQMVQDVEDTVRTSDGKVVGNLMIGCSEPSAFYILPHLIARFKRIYPNICVAVPVVGEETLLDKVMRGEFDLGITGVRHMQESDLRRLVFYEDQVVLTVPSAHPWAQRESVRFAELMAEPFICRSINSVCRQVVGSEMARLGYDITQMQIVMEIDSPEGQAIAVEHGIGLSFMPLLAVAQRLSLGRLAIVPVENVTLRTPIHMIYSAARPPSPILSQFVKFMNVPQTRSLIDILAAGQML